MGKGLLLGRFANFILCILPILLFCACSPQTPAGAGERSITVQYSPNPARDAAKTEDTPLPSPVNSPVTSSAAPSSLELIKAEDYKLKRPYELGQIMIIMYHGLIEGDDSKDYYQRNKDNFRNDLQTFYDRGFRLISLEDWFTNNITVEAGYSPLALTFDDGKATAFSLQKADGGLEPTTDCAVDIMTKFSDEHPDFGNTATFFICDGPEPFFGEGTLTERFTYLIEHGYDIGNHTQNHNQMNKMDAKTIQDEIGFIDQMIKNNAPGYIPIAFSYPYGIRPKEEFYPYILDGTYDGKEYHYLFGLREGQSGTPSAVNRVGFDPLGVPRVRASDNEDTDLGWQLRNFEEFPEKRYISDGLPDRISVPVEFAENLDRNSLNGKELYLYDENGNPAE
ncbi:MAG: polysaccharide deacetylase family protein [Clostridiales bacterium]|nr:polysaccharide deacetylase family protein [Clostridiales bacterium]